MSVAVISSLRRHLAQSARRHLTRQRRIEKGRAEKRRMEKRCQLELLESRWLMAGDLASWYQANQSEGPAFVGPIQPVGIVGTAVASFNALSTEAEGEAEDDLVAFAQSLSAAGVKFFGADWCPFCTEQKALFGDGARYLGMIEVTNPDRTLNDIGQEEGITTFPTWEFPDESRATGVLTLAEISELSGVPIPTGENPTFFPLEDVTVAAGSPLYLPIDAYDPNGGPLTITAVSSSPSVVMTEVPQGNPSLRITVASYGDMVFELFADKAPRPVERIIELVESGFYNAETHDEPILFHRVMEDFVIQAGDPTGTGAGGSTLGTFDDQFHVDLQHNQAGVLSFAKAGDDTNDSQFFVTAGPQRALDFNHSVFGQLIVGDNVRAGIDRVPTDEQDRPIRDVAIVSMAIEMDAVNGLVMLKAPHGVTGESDVTVTVMDPDGNSHSQTIRVTVVADTFNTAPFLDEIPPLSTSANVPLTFQLSAQDVEGDSMYFDAVPSGDTTFTFDIDHDTGEVTVNPPTDFIGTLELLVGVRGATPTDSVDQFDTQLLSIDVLPSAPTDIVLLSEFDTGVSDSDQITNLKQLGVRVEGLTTGAFVSVLVGNVVVGQGIAEGSSMVISTDLAAFSDGTYALTATQQIQGMTSERSDPLDVTIDTAAPVFESTAPGEATVGETLTYDAETDKEVGTAVTYSLVGAPTGMTIEPHTGVMTWTPSATQRGGFNFTLVATDIAGNTATQPMEIDVVGEEMVRFRLVTTNLEGTEVDSLAIGQEFYLQVFVADIREEARGVYAAYLDVLFTNELVTTAGDLEFGDQFPGDRVGDLTDPTRINDAGAIMELEETGDTEFLLFQVRMRAIGGGEEVIQSQYADNSPLRDTFVFGTTEPVPENLIGFGSATVLISSPFTAVNDLFNIDEDTSSTLDVLANDLFPGGDTSLLRIVAVGTPDQGGEVSITEDGRIFYQPAADFFGVESFTYTITDDVSGTSMATVTVQVQPVNDHPTAVDDFFTDDQAIQRNSSNNVLDLLANDTFEPDVDEVLRIISVGATSHGGTVTIAANGTHVFYTPATDFTGVETFEYTISDGNNGTDTALVTVEVEGHEFLPGQIGGVVYVDQNGNGHREGSEHPVAGVEVKLAGTDDLGQTIERTTRTDSQGAYVFADLPPGTYTVTENRPTFFATDTSSTPTDETTPSDPSRLITLVEGASVTDSHFAEKGPALSYLSIRDLFASNHPESVLVIVNGGTNDVITSGSTAWQSVQITSAQLTSSQSHWQLTAQDAEGTELVASVPNQAGRHLNTMGAQGNQTMIRLYGTPGMLGFQPASSSTPGSETDSSGSAEAEGEAASAQQAMAKVLDAPPLSQPPVSQVSHKETGIAVEELEPTVEIKPLNDPFAETGEAVWHDRIEDDVISTLAAPEPVKPEVVESALFSMMFASSRR
jgi:large repetitive protein